VFATLHTIDCVETINRIVDFFRLLSSAKRPQSRRGAEGTCASA